MTERVDVAEAIGDWEPMAERLATDDGEQLHRFLSTLRWDPAPLERALAELY